MQKLIVFNEGTHSFYGALKIKIIYGTVNIFGATVGKGFSDIIFSPFHQLAIPFRSNKPFCIQFDEVQKNELHFDELKYYDFTPDGFTELLPFVYYSYGNKGPKYPNSLIKKISSLLISGKPIKIFLFGGKGIGKSTLSNFLVNMLKSHPVNPETNQNNDIEEEEENGEDQKIKPNEDSKEKNLAINTKDENSNVNNNENNINSNNNDNDNHGANQSNIENTEPKYYHYLDDDEELNMDDDDDENSFINRKVAYVDFDPGQPEISLPTAVSFTKDCPFLFGSSEHHCTFSQESYTVSSVNISSALSNFSYVTHLFGRKFNQIQSNTKEPLLAIINSHGWIEDPGFQLQMDMINSMNPDLVICLYKSRSPPPSKFTNNQFNVKICPIKEIIHLEPSALRNIRFERYFMLKKATNDSIHSYIYCPISSLTPVIFSIKQFRYSFPFETNIKRCITQVPRILNCSLISFCIDPTNYRKDEEEKLLFPLVKPKAMRCCGFGYIRAIDIANQLLYIITPDKKEDLNKANTIMYLTSNVPLSFIRDSPRFYLPYNNLEINQHF